MGRYVEDELSSVVARSVVSWLLKLLWVPVFFVVAALGLLCSAVVLIASAADHQAAVIASPPHTDVLGLTAAQERGAAILAGYMNYDLNAIRAWIASEGNKGNAGQPAYNLLFLSCGVPEQIDCVELAGRKWAEFSSPDAFAIAAWNNLVRGQKQNYRGILSAAGTSALSEIIAIAASPWDGGNVAWGDPAGHYGGMGQNLLASYSSLTGIIFRCASDHACAQ